MCNILFAGFFNESLNSTWSSHDLKFIKVDWMVYVWAVVYAVQLAWLVASTEFVVSKTSLGPLYARPTVLPPSVFVVFFASLAFTLGWLCLWTTRDLHRYSPLCMMGSTGCAYVTLAIATNAVRKHGPKILSVGARQPLLSMYLYVFNGVALFAAWTTFVGLCSSMHVLVDWDILSSTRAGYVYVAIVGIYVAVYFVIDLMLPSHVVRWVFTPYVVCMLAMVEMVVNTEHDGDYYPLLAASVVLALTCTLTVLKVAISIGTRNVDDTKTVTQRDSTMRKGNDYEMNEYS